MANQWGTDPMRTLHNFGAAFTETNFNRPYNTYYEYDLNGNIEKLYRNGNRPVAVSAPGVPSPTFAMDRLTYHYGQRNDRLRQITEGAPTAAANWMAKP